jgi:hypothetical protein
MYGFAGQIVQLSFEVSEWIRWIPPKSIHANHDEPNSFCGPFEHAVPNNLCQIIMHKKKETVRQLG